MSDVNRLLDNGRHYHRLGRLEEAAAIYQQVRRQAPELALAHHLLGLVTYQLGRAAEALPALGEAVRLEPNLSGFRVGLAEGLRALGRNEEARDELAKAADLEPQPRPLLMRQAALWRELGDPERALERADRAIVTEPQSGEARHLRGLLYRDLGRNAAAIEDLMASRQGGEKLNDRHVALAQLLLMDGQLAALAALPAAATPRQTHAETLTKATGAWLAGDSEATQRHLLEADKRRTEAKFEPDGYWQGLQKQLAALIANRQGTPELYLGQPQAELRVIGDEQMLAAAQLILPIAGKKTRLQATVLPGAKAWHMIRPQANAMRAAALAAMDRAAGGLLLLGLGDLDCRFTSGFMDHLRRQEGADGDALVAKLALDYVSWAAAAAEARKIRLILMSPPASNAPLELLQPSIRRTYTDLVRLFARRLREAAAERGLGFVDLYWTTSSAGAGQTRGYYIDQNLILPAALVDSFQTAQFTEETRA